MSMPTVVQFEKYENIWPLSWALVTNKRKHIEVIYKMGVLTCTYDKSKIPFFTKDLTVNRNGNPDRPLKLTTLEMLEITGFKCGQPLEQ